MAKHLNRYPLQTTQERGVGGGKKQLIINN